MKSIKDIGSHKNKIGNKVIPLSLALVILVVSASPISSLQFIKPAMAGTLTSIAILPTNNIVNTRTTYDVVFKTATAGEIKTIEMVFPSGFDVSDATRWIERSGIGVGALTVVGQKLIYTVNSPVSIDAGINIRLEISRIDNSETRDIAPKVSITTKDIGGNTIDGPTNSPSFPIKAIEGLDIDPHFMNRKTLFDDTTGHALGWDPNGVTTDFTIEDHDVQIDEEAVFQTFVTVMLRNSHASNAVCMVNHTALEFFSMSCVGAPSNGAQLHYEIHKLPALGFIETSTSSSNTSSTISSPFSLLGEH